MVTMSIYVSQKRYISRYLKKLFGAETRAGAGARNSDLRLRGARVGAERNIFGSTTPKQMVGIQNTGYIL
jgi:hypothetical protein